MGTEQPRRWRYLRHGSIQISYAGAWLFHEVCHRVPQAEKVSRTIDRRHQARPSLDCRAAGGDDRAPGAGAGGRKGPQSGAAAAVDHLPEGADWPAGRQRQRGRPPAPPQHRARRHGPAPAAPFPEVSPPLLAACPASPGRGAVQCSGIRPELLLCSSPRGFNQEPLLLPFGEPARQPASYGWSLLGCGMLEEV